jgi:hypothetical protein
MSSYLLYIIEQIIPDDDFWEDVKVTVTLDSFVFVNEDWTCTVCCEDVKTKTTLPCCQQSLCKTCCKNWFEKESVKCPFCREDIREKIGN